MVCATAGQPWGEVGNNYFQFTPATNPLLSRANCTNPPLKCVATLEVNNACARYSFLELLLLLIINLVLSKQRGTHYNNGAHEAHNENKRMETHAIPSKQKTRHGTTHKLHLHSTVNTFRCGPRK